MTTPPVPPAPQESSAGRALAAPPPTSGDPRWTETLRDGTPVSIRPLRREDAALEKAFIERLSPESRRLRFLGSIGEPSDELVRRLTDLDYRRDAAFVATVRQDGGEVEIGVSRFSLGPDGRSCECAVVVAEAWRHRGLGTALMRHLIDLARARGARTMFSLDAADNSAMRELAGFLGFRRAPDPGDPSQVVHTLAL